MSGRAVRLELLARYLRPGDAQRALADAMARGHARERHGAELGELSVDAFRELATQHLTSAPRAWAIAPRRGPHCYLLTDPGSGLIAWIPPHREDRATLFKPEQGAEAFAAQRRLAGTGRGQQWTELDLSAVRPAGGRVPTRGISSSDRQRRALPDLGR